MPPSRCNWTDVLASVQVNESSVGIGVSRVSVAYEVIRHPRRGLTMRRGRRTAAEFDAAAVDEYARVMGLHLTPEELRIRQRRAAGRSINRPA